MKNKYIYIVLDMTFMNYPNDPLKLTPPMATLKCPYASTSWTCLDFFYCMMI